MTHTNRKILVPVFNDLSNDYRVFRTASCLNSLGFRVTVAGVEYPRSKPLSDWAPGIDLIRFPAQADAGKGRYLSYNWQLYRFGLKHRPDVIHANDLDTLPGSTLIARRCRIPLVYDSHELFVEQAPLAKKWKERLAWKMMETVLIRRVDHVITVCDSIADELRQRYDLPRPIVIRNVPLFQPSWRTTRIHETLNLPPEQKIVLYQGGLLRGLGLERLVEIGLYLKSTLLVLIGSGPLEDDLKKIVYEKNLSARVKFIPWVPFRDLAEYTAAADLGLVVFTGHGLNTRYALPNKLFEYLMAGLPVIGSPLPEIERIIRQYDVGHVCGLENLQKLAAKIEEFVNDNNAFQRYRENVRQAARELNWEVEQKKLQDMYQNLVLI